MAAAVVMNVGLYNLFDTSTFGLIPPAKDHDFYYLGAGVAMLLITQTFHAMSYCYHPWWTESFPYFGDSWKV